MKNYLKRNKPLLLLPLILLPFVILIFYVLGGGENPDKQAETQQKREAGQGANYKLPEADQNIRIYDKMDNARSQKEMTTTHDYDILGDKDSTGYVLQNNDNVQKQTQENRDNESGSGTDLNADVSSNLLAHIKNQEEQARKDLQQQEIKDQSPNRNLKSGTNSVLYKPERPKGKTEKETDSQNVSPTGIEELDKVFRQNISLSRRNDSLSTRLQEATGELQRIEREKNKHFELEKKTTSGFNPSEPAGSGSSLIKAEVYETVTVVTGNRVKLRVLGDCWLNGIKVPKNTFVYGICKSGNERLQIEVTQVPVNERFLPVDIAIYDLDGLPGLYIPDNAARKVAKEVGSSTNTSSMLGVTNNPLTYAGIQAADRTAQSLLKMIRIKKVTIKKNTLVYLINKSK